MTLIWPPNVGVVRSGVARLGMVDDTMCRHGEGDYLALCGPAATCTFAHEPLTILPSPKHTPSLSLSCRVVRPSHRHHMLQTLLQEMKGVLHAGNSFHTTVCRQDRWFEVDATPAKDPVKV